MSDVKTEIADAVYNGIIDAALIVSASIETLIDAVDDNTEAITGEALFEEEKENTDQGNEYSFGPYHFTFEPLYNVVE